MRISDRKQSIYHRIGLFNYARMRHFAPIDPIYSLLPLIAATFITSTILATATEDDTVRYFSIMTAAFAGYGLFFPIIWICGICLGVTVVTNPGHFHVEPQPYDPSTDLAPDYEAVVAGSEALQDAADVELPTYAEALEIERAFEEKRGRKSEVSTEEEQKRK